MISSISTDIRFDKLIDCVQYVFVTGYVFESVWSILFYPAHDIYLLAETLLGLLRFGLLHTKVDCPQARQEGSQHFVSHWGLLLLH